MTFVEWLKEKEQGENKGNMLPPVMEPQEAVDFLRSYLLGDTWYVVDPLSTGQVNTVIVHDILLKYSRKFRKEVKKEKR